MRTRLRVSSLKEVRKGDPLPPSKLQPGWQLAAGYECSSLTRARIARGAAPPRSSPGQRGLGSGLAPHTLSRAPQN